MIRYFKKKPIPVPMVEWTGENLDEIREFTGTFEATPADRDEPVVSIPVFQLTIGITGQVYNIEEHGWILCPVGHFVAKGVNGEFYPISPGVLEKTYDEVTL